MKLTIFYPLISLIFAQENEEEISEPPEYEPDPNCPGFNDIFQFNMIGVYGKKKVYCSNVDDKGCRYYIEPWPIQKDHKWGGCTFKEIEEVPDSPGYIYDCPTQPKYIKFQVEVKHAHKLTCNEYESEPPVDE